MPRASRGPRDRGRSPSRWDARDRRRSTGGCGARGPRGSPARRASGGRRPGTLSCRRSLRNPVRCRPSGGDARGSSSRRSEARPGRPAHGRASAGGPGGGGAGPVRHAGSSRRRPLCGIRPPDRAPCPGSTARAHGRRLARGRRVPRPAYLESNPMPSAIWTGAISFGLVQVPVRLVGATKSKDVSFNQLEQGTNSRIRYRKVSDVTGDEVPPDRIVRGYEISKGRYVVMEPGEIEALQPKGSHAIEIEEFVDLDEIDPLYFEQPYYLAPDKRGIKAYMLLVDAMMSLNKVAIGRIIVRSKERLVAI